MAKKYIRVQNTDRTRSDIELVMKYLGYHPDAESQNAEYAVKFALSAFCTDHVEGYNVFTGEVMKGENDDGL